MTDKPDKIKGMDLCVNHANDTDTTLDEILKRRGVFKNNYECIGWEGLNESLQEAFEKGKTAGREEEQERVKQYCNFPYCEDACGRAYEKGREEERERYEKMLGYKTGNNRLDQICVENEKHTKWQLSCFECNQERKEKIATLEAERKQLADELNGVYSLLNQTRGEGEAIQKLLMIIAKLRK